MTRYPGWETSSETRKRPPAWSKRTTTWCASTSHLEPAGQPSPTKTTGLGEALTDAVRAVSRQNSRLQGVIDVVDFNATTAGQRIVEDQRLAALVQVLSRHRLGITDVEPDVLGRAYEYLLRKFAEGQGQSAGEYFTPPEVGLSGESPTWLLSMAPADCGKSQTMCYIFGSDFDTTSGAPV